MKHILVLLAVTALGFPCHSQDTPVYSSKSNEFNIGYFNLFDLNSTNSFGIGYKHSGEKGAFRVGTGFSYLLRNDDIESYPNRMVNNMSFSPRIGYEFHQWFNRLRVHYGVDAVSGYSKYIRENLYDDPANDYIDRNTTLSAGVRPLLGVTYFLNSSISLSTETYFHIGWSRQTNESIDGAGTTTRTNSSVNTSMGPLGIISVNIHF